MAYVWARWLLPAFRSDPFVERRLVVLNGWDIRGRPPSTGSFFPTGNISHHTACMIRDGHDPQACVAGILAGNSVAPGPISHYLGTFTPPGVRWNGRNADPRIVLIAAGRCNHAGVGEYFWGAPGGNASAVAGEWCGPPDEQYPDVVVELMARTSAAIMRWNGWPLNDTTHHEYARPKGRKIDRSGPWRRQPHLRQLDPWDAPTWRDEIRRYLDAVPEPPPPPPPTPPPTEVPLKMWLIAKVLNGPHLATSGLRAGALHIPSEISADDVFAAGGGYALALLGDGAFHVIPQSEWSGVPARFTEAQVLAKFGAQI